MRLCLLLLAIIGYCFNINSTSSCCKKDRNDNSSGECCGCCCKGCRLRGWNPGQGNKFDADINVGPDGVTIKPVGGSEIKLVDGNKVDLNENKLLNNSFHKYTTAYKFDYSMMIKNANVTVDDDWLKNTPYLIAIVSLKGDESSKYIVIVSKEDGNMSDLFANTNLTSVSILLSAGITNMSDMFRGCNDLTVCNINIDTSKVTNMSRMFFLCKKLTSLPGIFKWNTSKVTNMSYMFFLCEKLTSLPDISNWNTSNVIDMSYMFHGCSLLSSLPDISKWNTSNVTNMSYMFTWCKSLTSLPDIGKWDISKVTGKSCMFSRCDSLDKSKIPDNFKSAH